MIKKSGLALISVALIGEFEALILGYGNFLVYVTVLSMVIASDIIIFNTTLARKLREITVKREIKRSLGRRGEFLEVVLTFQNPLAQRIYFHFYDTLSTVFKVDGNADGDISLLPGETATRTYRIASKAVGKYKVGPIIVYAEDALRLCISSYILTRDSEVKIAPSMSDISTLRSDRLSNFKFTQGLHISKNVGQGYNFYGIRQYEESDEFRYVAWSRYGFQNGEDIYVKQMEEERTINVVFVLDYSTGVNQGSDRMRLYDNVISSTISAAYSILKNHDGVGFMLSSSVHDYFIAPEKTQKGVEQFERIVAGIRPEGFFSLDGTISRINESVKGDSLIFILTPFSYSERFDSDSMNLHLTGKRANLFLINRYDYLEKTEDETDRKLLMSAGLGELRRLKGISAFFNSLGIRTRVVEQKQIFLRIMTDYKYRKVVM